MNYFKDQLGYDLSLERPPRRIISLVPSQSEYLWDLGLHAELTGITKFCIHPHEMFSNITRVGGTKKVDREKIAAIGPDLIIGNKEENDKDDIEFLRSKYNVWVSDIVSFEDAFDMMTQLALITGKVERGSNIIRQARESVDAIKNIYAGRRTLYFIWKDPNMFSASGTFTHTILQHCGLKNCLKDRTRYPELSTEEMVALHPELCLLSSEPFPFKEKDADEIRRVLPNAEVKLVDGEMFSWYGSRMILMKDYFRSLKLG
jgi:ABC-type Fe3+-hydroxamate transport system substrate-binding protein